MAAGLGFKDFVTGEVLTAADVDGYLMQGIWVFADAAARDAAVTSPQEGNACYLKDTNAVQTYSGTAWVAVGGGGGGKVLQVVQGTTTTAVTNATTTMTDTGLTVSITPSLATSKVLIIATQNWFQNQNDSISIAQQFAFRVLRGATEIFDAHGTSNRAFGIERPVRTSTMYLWGYANFSVLDSPSTTSATTYKLQGRNTVAAGTLVTQNESCQSTILALEIGA